MIAEQKTITTSTGEQFTLDFYCERRRAHMTFLGCDRMQSAAIEKKNSHHLMSQVSAVDDNPCLDCPQGKKIKITNKKKASPRLNQQTQCIWPDCNEPIHSMGLCQKHSRAVKRNSLIQLNTGCAGVAAVRGFLEKLIQMSQDVGMPIEDVALAAMDEGVKVYFERKERRRQA